MPSLYESTVNTGEVSSSNFTTLYNASGLAVPNAGAGQITGNLNVGGNLTVQGNSLLVGDVTLQSTLSLPNYQFPIPDGSTFQVITTDGNGNLYWSSVQALPGADYNISATPATGGANLTLANTAGFTDSVRFASGTNIVVSRTDANTITISTIADNIPDGTAQGQVLYWDGSAWVASSNITSAAANDRLVVEYNNSGAGVNSALFIRKDYGATAYTTNDGVGHAFQLDSDSQTLNQIATINAQWKGSPGATEITLNTNTLDNSVGPFTPTATFSVAQATLPGDLAVNGGDITTTNVTGNLFNANAVVVNIGNGATTEVNLGNTASGRVQIKSPTIVGANTTQAVFNTVATTANAFGAATAVNIGANSGTMTIGNPTVVGTQATQALYNTVATTVNAFGAANTLNMGSATSLTTLGNNLSINGDTLKINASGAAADNYIYFNGTNESLKWNQADSRFELSDQLYITQADSPAIFERRVTTSEVNPNESKGSVRLLQRVTDAVSNATDNGGPAVVFGRTSGATDPTEQLFASMGSVWYGTDTKAALLFNWSTDNFTEPTPGTFPLTYTLLKLDSDYARFFNDSIYVDYANVASTKTATSITGGNTLVFGSAHGYTAGTRILYQTASANGLIQSSYYYVLATGLTSTQCQVSTISGGTALALTNGTGLTLTFAEVVNRIGVNTDNPLYTLDVDGDARVTGNIISAGITAGNITVGVVNDNTISTTTGALDITAATGSNVEITSDLTNATVGPTRIIRTTANTTGGVRALSLRTDSTGTPAVGLGTSLDYEVETAAGTFTRGGYVEIVSTDITSGNEDFAMNFGLTSNGTLTTRATLDNTGTLTLDNDLAVNGGDITTTQTTGNLFNTTATTVNIGNGATTEVNLGNVSAGQVQIKSPTIVGANTTQAVFNTVATTVNAFGAATNITMGVDGAVAGAGTTTIRSATTIVKGDLQVNGDNTGSVANITTTKTSAAVFDTNATTVDAFGASTTTNIGSTASGTTTVGYDLVVGNDLTVTGNTIKKSGGTDVIQFSGTNTVSVPGLFQVEVADTDAQINIGSEVAIATDQTTTTVTSATAITSTQRNAMSGLITITDTVTSARHVLNFTMLRNGASSPMLTTFGEMYTGTPLATFTADLSGSDIRLLATPASTNNTRFNVVRTASL